MIVAEVTFPHDLLAVIDALAALGRAVQERQEQKAACSVNFVEESLQAANRQDPTGKESHHAGL